jgi:AGCS family alanine or glycine:cation symporter
MLKSFLLITLLSFSQAFAQGGLQEGINDFFKTYLVDPTGAVLFFDVLFWKPDVSIPFILLVLCLGGIFFTFRFNFINIKFFKHAIDVVRGKYDNPNSHGEISHFKALTSALSATVGLGNIAGVAVAIAAGGPGAVFWMWVTAFFGMSMKFTSCTLAQLYRKVKGDGTVIGGPMVFLQEGLKEKYPSKPWLGKIFGITFAVCTIAASFGGGNLFQGNQTYSLIAEQMNANSPMAPWVVGIILSLLVSSVIIGGIKRIGNVTSKMVPLMCGIYSVVCLIIVFSNFGQVPGLLGSIFVSAFSPEAAFGGFLGVLIQGVQRASFSNESGLGSAAIAHSAAKTDQPVREGFVAMIGPFIDTHVVCTMTALALLITGAHKESSLKGVEMTSHAFGSLHSGLPLLLTVIVVIFAYSTMISWSYYGEKATEFLFGENGIKYYRVVYCLLVILGPVLSVGAVIDFSDIMLFSMAVPNIIGMVILSGVVKGKLAEYAKKYKAGEFKTYS